MATADASTVSGRRLTADIAVQIVGRVLNLILGVAVTIVVVRALGEHRFGQWSTIFAVSDLAGYIGELGIDRVTVRHAAAERDKEPEYLGAMVSIRALLSIPVTLAFLAITLAISQDSTMRLSALILALLLLMPPLSSLIVVFQLRVRNDLTMAVMTLNSVVWTASAVIIAVLSGGMVAMSVAFVGAFVVGLAVQTVLVRRLATVHVRASRPLWKELARFAVPVGIAGMLTLAYGRIDQVLVFQLAGANDAGLYGAMYRILNTTAFVPMAVMTTLFPVLSSVNRDEMRRLVQQACEYLAMASLPIFFFVLVASAEIVNLLFGPDFVQGHNALKILMGAFVAICFGYVGGSMIVVLRLQRMFIRYAVVALVINVGLNLIFVPKYGYIAAAWITLITEVFVQAFVLREVFKEIGLHPKWLRFARVALASAAMGLFTWAAKQAGVPLAGLVVVAAITYPLALIVLRAVSVSELRALVRR
ncbi:MAG TPA: flippase [Thermoleophilaceae bacterium]|nr:flippase [Thermoleophilaceae bacterium]